MRGGFSLHPVFCSDASASAFSASYLVLLCSQFQGFCRDLHAEAADHLVEPIQPKLLRIAVRTALTWRRALDRGNPTPDNLADDFNRLGIAFWPDLNALDSRSEQRKTSLANLNKWRNAIAHHDFDATKLGGRTTVTLQMVRQWRSACNGLAQTFDRVVGAHINQTTGTASW